MSFRRFVLDRKVDVSGVSGTGIVAQGVEFDNGKCAVSFVTGPVHSVICYDSVADVIQVHGHDNATQVRFIDEEKE
jgi:hypothetical protein